jgi:hypothetical protein
MGRQRDPRYPPGEAVGCRHHRRGARSPGQPDRRRRAPGDELIAEEGGGDLTTFAAALDFEPPYRAEAVRRSETLWALACRRIEVIELAGVDGERIELASHGGERTLRVHGEQVFGSIPTLERNDHVVRAIESRARPGR